MTLAGPVGAVVEILVAACLLALLAPAQVAFASAWQAHISTRLSAELQREGIIPSTVAPAARRTLSVGGARFDAAGGIQVDISHPCGQPVDAGSLAAAGFHVSATASAPPFCVVEGWVSASSVPYLASLSNVTLMDLPHYARVRGGASFSPRTGGGVATMAGTTPIDGNGVSIMNADLYASSTGINGSGVTVGVISDDDTSLATIQGRGELPGNITNYCSAADPCSGSTFTNTNLTPTDEGTMMLEEVHAVAPGAALAFCGPQTDVEYVQCLQAFANAHVNIVADDLGFLGEDIMSNQSTFTQGVQNVLQGDSALTLFSASGNNEAGYWEGNYAPTQNTTGLTLTCNGHTDAYVENFGSAVFDPYTFYNDSWGVFLEWDDPYSSNISNFDLYVVDPSNHNAIVGCVSGSSQADPVDALWANGQFTAGKTYDIYIGNDGSLAGKFLKLDIMADGASSLGTTSTGGLDSPQQFAIGDQPIGAVNGSDGVGASIEPYSQQGPINLAFWNSSTTLSNPLQQIDAPVLVAPDGIYVDNSGTDFSTNMFFGTSAATPNAAASLALLEGAFKSLSASQLMGDLEQGAYPLSPPWNGTFGYGRVDVWNARQQISLPTVSPIKNLTMTDGQSASTSVMVSGTAPLTISVSSANSILIPAANVALSPSNCGQSGYSNNCSLTITPVSGQSGTTNLTVTVANSSNESQATTFTVTVDPPALTGGSAGGGGGGGGGCTLGHAGRPDPVLPLLVIAALFGRLRRRLRPHGNGSPK
ncbi:MAG: JDVT-CTERM domain-containing protein [Betaproteobacteria bacterium]|nr:JDVT-CTERM domain-containing protein [Betaproteobacteria bacterium]